MNRFLRLFLEALPILLFVFCAASYLVDPAFFAESVVAKDSVEGAGLIESLTVVVLLIGIVFGCVTVFRNWNRISNRLVRVGLVLWILACIYFAGEEVSWGQWYFHWSTPDTFADINRQEETNFHNTSSWLNEKPRTMVELWFLFAGLFVALARFRGKWRFPDTDWREWINPYSLGISACCVFLVSKGLDFGNSQFAQEVSDSEIRELIIAYFLSLYLLSTWMKLRRRRETSAGRAEGYPNKSTTGLPLSATVKGRILGE